jgi:hypothetical protein
MEQRRSVDIRHGIADTLTSGASLPVRSLAYRTNLTSRTVLATLPEDGPARLTALTVGTGVSQPAKTRSVGRTLSRHDDAALGMAMRAALPLIEQLTRETAEQPRSQSRSAR